MKIRTVVGLQGMTTPLVSDWTDASISDVEAGTSGIADIMTSGGSWQMTITIGGFPTVVSGTHVQYAKIEYWPVPPLLSGN